MKTTCRWILAKWRFDESPFGHGPSLDRVTCWTRAVGGGVSTDAWRHRIAVGGRWLQRDPASPPTMSSSRSDRLLRGEDAVDADDERPPRVTLMPTSTWVAGGGDDTSSDASSEDDLANMLLSPCPILQKRASDSCCLAPSHNGHRPLAERRSVGSTEDAFSFGQQRQTCTVKVDGFKFTIGKPDRRIDHVYILQLCCYFMCE